eukprot:Gb_26310 [translate_table: standard]
MRAWNWPKLLLVLTNDLTLLGKELGCTSSINGNGVGMARPFWNSNKKMASLLRICISTLTIKTNINVLQDAESHRNANGNNSSFSVCQDVKTLCKQGRLENALQILHLMDRQGVRAESYAYDSLLQGCVTMKALPEGKLVHAHMMETGFKPEVYLGTKLVVMYTKCETLVDARRVFDEMPKRNVVSWNAIIAAYARHGRCEEALVLYSQMQRTDIQPDQFTFASVLPACANLTDLEHGEKIHKVIIRSGCQGDIFVGNALVDMYAKCGSIESARQVFDKMPKWDVISWSAMIAGYSQAGRFDEALKLFRQMQQTGVKPDSFTLASVLPACANFGALRHGKEVHVYIIKSEFQSNIFVGNALVDMYSKCGSLDNARMVFDKMPERNVVSWTAMIAGYAQIGFVDEAHKLFETMPERNVISWTAMVAGFAWIGEVDEALKLFEKTPERNVVSWTAMIAGYAQNGLFDDALKLFRQMQQTPLKPNSDTFASILPACANLAALHNGSEVHEHIIRNGFDSDVFVSNALVHMYAKCGSLENARKVFDKISRRDVVSWNAMIGGYAQSGYVDNALKLFEKMPERNLVSWNAMTAGYAQKGYVDEAMKLFQQMPQRNVISWTVMIAGYAQNGHFDKALKLFQEMQQTGIKPSSETLASVLSSCGSLAALHEGKEVHEDIIRSEFQSDVFVCNALIDMYAKCGSIEEAHTVFDNMPTRDVVSWNAMIAGNAIHGCGREALQLFEQMQHTGTKPDHITFIGVLSACCHGGLLDDGWHYFDCMRQDYHITPTIEHYCCMVDLLGRAGHLDEAHNFINEMPIKPDAAVWGSLLGACRIHNNIELAEHVAERLFESDDKKAAHYVLLSNIYAEAGRWDDVENLRNMMKHRSVKKIPGCSWIEVNNKVYAFLIGDRSHPQTKKNLC